jgi:Rps23 Pro-64 3,4-dihydroxylase Tpa1-like proline 4-hydroxylase
MERWLEGLPYRRRDYDDASAKQYLHFVHEIALDALDQQPLYRQLRSAVSGEIEAAYGDLSPRLDRAHVNLGPYGDHFTAHIDSRQGVTAIYFANGTWHDEWQGETLFYHDDEAVTAVAPRPGRLVLLPGDMVHRVGAPSRLFSGARYTVAFKFETAEKPA